MSYPVVQLKPGRERPILAGHPWIFSGALASVDHRLIPGSVVDAFSARGEFVGRGYLNPANSLALRILTRDRDEAIDQAFFDRRIKRAASLRARLLAEHTNAFRVVHAEGDFLPGLIVDRYDRWLVAQIHTAGMERLRDQVVAALRGALDVEGILIRNDIGVRGREGLAVGEPEVAWGEVPARVTIMEGGVHYLVDPYRGQKTGFFLDQRDKRALVRELAKSAQTLFNGFSYSGAFSLAALASNPGLRTINVDASQAALDLARENYALNGHGIAEHEYVAEDVGAFLKGRIQDGTRYDIVVIDPPAYAKSQDSKNRALYGYESLNTLAAAVVADDGYLLTCSCSGVVDLAEFEAVTHAALLHARREAQLVATFSVSTDHPTLPGFPEDRYLKALLFRVI